MSKFSNFYTRDLHNEAFIALSDDEDDLSYAEYENFKICLQVLMILHSKKMVDNKIRKEREKFLLKKNMNSKQQDTTQIGRETFVASKSKVKDSSSSKKLSTNLVGISKSSSRPSFHRLSDINTETPKSSRTKCSTVVHLAAGSLRPDKLSAEIPVEVSREILKSSIPSKHKSKSDLAKPQISKLTKTQKPVEMQHSKTNSSLNNLSKFNTSKMSRIHLKNKNTECKNQLQGIEKNYRLNSNLAFSTPESNLESSSCEDNMPEAPGVLKFGFNAVSSEPPKKTLQEKNLSEFSLSVPERKTKTSVPRKSSLREENPEYAKKRLWKNEKDKTDNKPVFSTPNNSKSKSDSYKKSEPACAPACNLKARLNKKRLETNKTLQNEEAIKLQILSLGRKADEYFRLRKTLEDKAERYKNKSEFMNELSGKKENSQINTKLAFPTRTNLESAACFNLSDTSNSSNPYSSTDSPKISNITLQSRDTSEVNASYFYYGTKISFEEKKLLEDPIFDKIGTSSRRVNYNTAEMSKAMALKQKSAEEASDTLHSLLLSNLQISTPQPKTKSSRYQTCSRKSI